MLIQYQKEIIAALIEYSKESERVKSEIGLKNFSEPYKTALGIIYDNESLDEASLVFLLREIPNFPLKEILDIKINSSLMFLDTAISRLRLELDKKKITEIIKNESSSLTLYETLKEESEQFFNSHSANTITPYHEDLDFVFSELEKDSKSKTNNNLKSTRFPKLNDITGGFNPSNIIGIAGVFKSGKTSFALSLMIDYLNQNIPVCFFSLELSKDELIKKIISYETGIKYSSLRDPKQLTDEEQKTLSRYWNTEKKLKRNLFVETNPISVFEAKSKMRALKRAGVKTFFLDYIGYLRSDSNFENRERELTFNSNFLKRTAKELDITIFLLAQLNRSGKSDPSSFNLAESVGLARDCDFLFTISEASIYGNVINKQYGIINLENKFVLKLDSSRHSEQGKMILLGFTQYGMQQAELSEAINPQHHEKNPNWYEKEQKEFPI